MEVWEVGCPRGGECRRCGLSPAVGEREKGAGDKVQVWWKAGSTP
jgi:hypothetical protein